MTMLNRFFILITFLVISNSYALDKNILTIYRYGGLENLEKVLDKQLTKVSYWKSEVNKFDTKFGYFEKYENILICDKSKHNLVLYTKQNNKYTRELKYSAFTGKVKGDKIKEGDLKTPVGIYNLVKKISKIDSFYGPMAFVTSYPNLYDIYKEKTGQGIWIHGLPTDQKRDSFTKGCIAINNDNIKCLDKNIDISKTILIIYETSKKRVVSKKTFATILSQLYKWRYAWIYNDVESYLNFYNENFKKANGMGIDRFKRYKRRIFAKNETKSIIFKAINIIPYPNTKDIYEITFNEKYHSNTLTFNGKKTLIIKLKNSKMSIITEE